MGTDQDGCAGVNARVLQRLVCRPLRMPRPYPGSSLWQWLPQAQDAILVRATASAPDHEEVAHRSPLREDHCAHRTLSGDGCGLTWALLTVWFASLNAETDGR